MKLIDKLKSSILRKSVSSDWFAMLAQAQANQNVVDKYESYAKEAYLGNPVASACIDYIAKSVAGVSWQVKSNRGTDNESTIDQHPLLDLLRHPNPLQGRTRFMVDVVSYWLLAGNSYILRIGPNDVNRPPRELYTLRPDMMTPVRGSTLGSMSHYEYRPNGGSKIDYSPEEICHLDFWDPLDNVAGPSPQRPGAWSIDQNNEGRKWNTALLQNGARLSGLLSTESIISKETREKLEAELKDKFAGSTKAGKFLLAEGGLKFQEMGTSPKDMDWLEGQRQSAREICIVNAVPPELIGDATNKTYANYQEARKAFYEDTVLPLLDYMRDEFNNWLVPLYGQNIYLDYNSDDIEALQEDRDKFHARIRSDYTAGLLTRNEARLQLGFGEDTTDPTSNEFRTSGGILESIAENSNSTAKAIEPHNHKKLRPMTVDELAVASVMESYFSEQLSAITARIE